MRAEVTLRRRAVIRIDVNRVVRAGLHARLTTDAGFGTEIDDAVLSLVHRADRANRDARWLLAMIAASDLEDPPSVWELSFLNVLDPGAIYAHRNLIFSLAGDRAGMATDAPAIVDDKSVFHSEELWKKSALRVSHQLM